MAIVDRARVAVESLPGEVVYVGFSLGLLPALSLAQTRPYARRGALLLRPTARRVGRQLAGDVAGRRAAAAAHPEGDEDFEVA